MAEVSWYRSMRLSIRFTTTLISIVAEIVTADLGEVNAVKDLQNLVDHDANEV